MEKIFHKIDRMVKKIGHHFAVFMQTSVAGLIVCPRFVRKVIYNIFGNRVHTSHVNARCFVGGQIN